jgi:AraC-like DNA-binding protein/galactitol-specific phosphotransferase system IIB component
MEAKHILVVEDEAFIAMHIQQVLEEEGYSVMIKHNTVAKAKKYLADHDVDLVIIDVQLNSTETGIELAHYLKTINSIPYLFLTSYSDKETLTEISETKPAGFLVKPFKSEDLVSTVFLILTKFSDSQDDKIPFQIRQVIEYVHQHIETRINIKDLANLTRWEVTHFSRLFKKHLHLTPHQYILAIKIELAKKQLIESDESLQEIALNLGFGAYSNFFNAFKKMTKLTPEKYRLQNQPIK